MTTTFDLVIRGGTIADGSGGDLFEADVAIKNGRISDIGNVSGKAREEIDARGKLVAPGFIDTHTHYDGQVTWSDELAPSSNNGVTTVVMGNCGMGFAPCRPADHARLIEFMEGVEDIPEPVLSAGVPWQWESFTEYMDWLAARKFDIDIGAQLPHAPLRLYVMGDRGVRREPATAKDRAEMALLAGEAVRAGALGFTTSRYFGHRTLAGESMPMKEAAEEELLAIAMGMRTQGHSAMQYIPDMSTAREDLQIMLRIAEKANCRIATTVVEDPRGPGVWRETLDAFRAGAARGLSLHAQVAPRSVGIMLGFDLSRQPFFSHATYRTIAHLPLAERLAKLRQPDVRTAILGESPGEPEHLYAQVDYDQVFVLSDPPDYEQPAENSIGARSRRLGVPAQHLAYDTMATGETGTMLHWAILSYSTGNLDLVLEMLRHPSAIPSLSDGGAHSAFITDASFPTFMLTHWTRDRSRGEKLSIPFVINAHTRRAALSVGMADRGLLARGYKADLNVIDYERLRTHAPKFHHDLPAGGRRLIQRVEGYEATIVSGVVTRRTDSSTDARPGRLVRGSQGDLAQR